MNRNLGVHILTSRNVVKIEDTLKKAEAELKTVAHRIKSPIYIDESYDEKTKQLMRTSIEIPNLMEVYVGWDGLVEEIRLDDANEHDLDVRNIIYSFDELNKAGYEIIQRKDRHIDWAPDTVDDIFDHVSSVESSDEEPLIFGNDKVNRVAFVINSKAGVITSMVIKRYSHDYPFNISKYTSETW